MYQIHHKVKRGWKPIKYEYREWEDVVLWIKKLSKLNPNRAYIIIQDKRFIVGHCKNGELVSI